MEVPAFAFVGYLQAVHPAAPIGGELGTTEFPEIGFEPLHVDSAEARAVSGGQNYVFGLFYFFGPELDFSATVKGESWRTYRAVEEVTSIEESVGFQASSAETHCLIAATFVQRMGKVRTI